MAYPIKYPSNFRESILRREIKNLDPTSKKMAKEYFNMNYRSLIPDFVEFPKEKFTYTKEFLQFLEDEEGVIGTKIVRKSGNLFHYEPEILSSEKNLPEKQNSILKYLHQFELNLGRESFSFTKIYSVNFYLGGRKDIKKAITSSEFKQRFRTPISLKPYFEPASKGQDTLEEIIQAFYKSDSDLVKFRLAENMLLQLPLSQIDYSQSYFKPIPIIQSNRFKGIVYLVFDKRKIRPTSEKYLYTSKKIQVKSLTVLQTEGRSKILFTKNTFMIKSYFPLKYFYLE